ncbi:MAG: hypothetical protein EBS53_18425, partial [Bacteroidetes bacterium]|nr:hypothetical protein [Bacteroidota bacterium]
LLAGIANTAGNAFDYTLNNGVIPNIDATPLPVVDSTAPSLQVSSNFAGVATGPVKFKFSFSEPVIGFELADVNLNYGFGKSNLTGNAENTEFEVTVAGYSSGPGWEKGYAGTVSLTVGSFSFQDYAGNSNLTQVAVSKQIQDYTLGDPISIFTSSGYVYKLLYPFNTGGNWYYIVDFGGSGTIDNNDKINEVEWDNLKASKASQFPDSVKLLKVGEAVNTFAYGKKSTIYPADSLKAIWKGVATSDMGYGFPPNWPGIDEGYRNNGVFWSTEKWSGTTITVRLYDGLNQKQTDFDLGKFPNNITRYVAVLVGPPASTPIVLALSDQPVSTVDQISGLPFITASLGFGVKSGWIAPSNALLVRDLNHDGVINDGSELFGDSTRLKNGTTA